MKEKVDVTVNVGCCEGCGMDVRGGQRCKCDEMREKAKLIEVSDQLSFEFC